MFDLQYCAISWVDLHVGLKLLLAYKVVRVALYRHVVQAEQAVELDPKGLSQLLLVDALLRTPH